MRKGLVRTVISLDDEQKAWLDRQAALRRVSMASLIRQAVSEFQIRERLGSAASFQRGAQADGGHLAGRGRTRVSGAYSQGMALEGNPPRR